MKYFDKNYPLASDSDFKEIKRFGNVLKRHHIKAKVVIGQWSNTKPRMIMESVGVAYGSIYDHTSLDNEIYNIDMEKYKFHIRLETGKNSYSIGILKGYQISFESEEFYTRLSMYIKFDTPDGEKILKRFVERCTFMPPDSELRFISPTPIELRQMKEHLCAVKTNKFGRDMTIGTLIVAWNTSTRQMYYGKITKMYIRYFEYSIPDGTIKRCYNTNMVYVPENQEEFEFELSMEILKA